MASELQNSVETFLTNLGSPSWAVKNSPDQATDAEASDCVTLSQGKTQVDIYQFDKKVLSGKTWVLSRVYQSVASSENYDLSTGQNTDLNSALTEATANFIRILGAEGLLR